MTDKPISWTGFICESFWPRPLDPIETWEQFLAEVQAMPDDDPIKEYAIEKAKRVIDRMRQYLRARRYGVEWVQ